MMFLVPVIFSKISEYSIEMMLAYTKHDIERPLGSLNYVIHQYVQVSNT